MGFYVGSGGVDVTEGANLSSGDDGGGLGCGEAS